MEANTVHRPTWPARPTSLQVARAADVASDFLPEVDAEKLAAVAEAVLVEHMRFRIEDHLPALATPRGGIVFLAPPGPPTLLDRVWRRPVYRALRPWRAVKTRVARERAARQRARQARRVWRGELTAIHPDRLARLEELD
jgi:hypothetical protein